MKVCTDARGWNCDGVLTMHETKRGTSGGEIEDAREMRTTITMTGERWTQRR